MATVTWNPDDKDANVALSDGNLKATPLAGTGTPRIARATRAKLGGGRWYFECHMVTNFAENPVMAIGLVTKNHVLLNSDIGTSHFIRTEDGFGVEAKGTIRYTKIGSSDSEIIAYLPVWITNNVVGIAYDLYSGDFWVSIDGVWVGGGTPGIDATPAVSGLNISLPLYPAVNVYSYTIVQYITAHFAEADFTYTPPAGFNSIEYPEFDSNGGEVIAGEGVVSGTITEFLVPGAYMARIHDSETGALVQTTWSDSNGQYTFTGLSTTREFYVVAFDHTEPQQTAVIQDRVVPS